MRNILVSKYVPYEILGITMKLLPKKYLSLHQFSLVTILKNKKIMASRRNLKKHVNYIAGELFAECLVNRQYVPGIDKTKADQLMIEILEMQHEFISRISHTQPGNVKLFYKKFRADFNAQVSTIIDNIIALN